MSSTLDRLDFYPPRPRGTGRAVSLALLAHLALLGALAWGVSWKREATVSAVEAELWSALPQQAAAPLQAAPPPPESKPAPEPEPAPPKPPEIAVEKEKPRPLAKPEVKPAPKPEPQAAPKPRVNKVSQDRKLTEQNEKERQEAAISRAQKIAGASGTSDTLGNSMQTASMTNAWNGRVKARVNPQIIFNGDRSALKELELSITILSDGTISGRPRILKSSGNSLWDEAVVRAFEKAESLPRDTNGRLPPSPFKLIWIPTE